MNKPRILLVAMLSVFLTGCGFFTVHHGKESTSFKVSRKCTAEGFLKDSTSEEFAIEDVVVDGECNIHLLNREGFDDDGVDRTPDNKEEVIIEPEVPQEEVTDGKIQ